MASSRVSVVVVSFNTRDKLVRCLSCIEPEHEIIVVDSQSTDDTVAIARRYTDKVIVRPWPGYIAQKNFAAEQASHDWIFSLDADERIPEALASEIRALLAREWRAMLLSASRAIWRSCWVAWSPRSSASRTIALMPALPSSSSGMISAAPFPNTFIAAATRSDGS